MQQRRLSDPTELRALAHPVRMAIIEQLSLGGPLTATELADRLDETPANCSWHLRKLAEHGFVEEAPSAGGRRRPWQVPAIGFTWKDADETPEAHRAAVALSEMWMDRALERMRESDARAPEQPRAWRDAATGTQSVAWLTAEELMALNLEIREVVMRHLDRVEDPSLRPPGARLCEFVAWGVPIYLPGHDPVPDPVPDEVPDEASNELRDPGGGPVRAAFARPGFGRLYAGLTTSMLGDSVMLLVLSMWVKTLTGSNAMAGLTFLFMVLPAILAPLLGIWVDRLSRQKVLVRGNLLSAAAVLPLLAVRDAGDVWIVWAVAFLYGLSFVVLPAALNGLLKDLLPDEALVDANAALQTTKEGFRLFGPLVGAALFAAVGGWAVALVDAASFLVAAALISTLTVHEEPVEREVSTFWHQLTAGTRFLGTDRVLKHVLVGFGLMVLVIGFFEASIYALLDAFDKEATYAGFLVTVQGVGAVLGGLSSAHVVRRLGEVGALVVGLGLIAAATAGAAAAPSIVVVLGCMVVMGFGLPCTFVPFMTLVQRRSPRTLVGRVSAAVEVLMATPQAVSLAVGAVLVSVLDYRTIFWVIAAVIGAGAAYIGVVLRDTVGRPAPAIVEESPA